MAVISPYEKAIQELEQKNVGDVSTAQQAAGSQAQQAYINWMQSKKGLDEGLRRQGITGGGSESALLGANVGYQRQKNLIASQLQGNLNALAQNFAANRTALETQNAAWQQAEQAREEERFANTITGYDTVQKIDTAIDAARGAGMEWKIPYLMAQRAALLEQAKAVSASSVVVSEPKTIDQTYQPVLSNNILPDATVRPMVYATQTTTPTRERLESTLAQKYLDKTVSPYQGWVPYRF